MDKVNEALCGYSPLKRTRYFHGMLLSDRDFREEQLYHVEKLKKLNRSLWGWGVICGLELTEDKHGCGIVVQPGMALDCNGNLIDVCERFPLDLSKVCCEGKKSGYPQTKEECEAAEEEAKTKERYVCLRYKQWDDSPVPVYIPGADCEQRVCEHSRVREGFCIELVESCPRPEACRHLDKIGGFYEAYSTELEALKGARKACDDRAVSKCTFDDSRKQLDKLCEMTVPCPDCCPEEHCVILGQVTIDCSLQA